MKKPLLITIIILIILSITIVTIFIVQKYYKDDPPPPSATDLGLIQPNVEGVQEIKDIDRFLTTYNFNIVDTPIEEVILSNTSSGEICLYNEAIINRKSEPIKDLKVPTAILEATELEGIATREIVKDVSIYYKNKADSGKLKDDGYIFHGALWDHKEITFGTITRWHSCCQNEDTNNGVPSNKIVIPRPQKIYAYYDEEYSSNLLFFFVYNEFITYYAGGLDGDRSAPWDISTFFSTSLQATQVTPDIIEHLQQKKRALSWDFLERGKR